MRTLILVIFGLFMLNSIAQAASDSLSQQRLTIKAGDAAQVVESTLDNVKEVFEKYQVALDSSTTIIKPLQIGGTQDHPTMKVTLKKCVTFICQEVELNAEISAEVTRGRCDRNYVLTADLGRSGQILTDLYDSFTVSGCLHKTATGGILDLDAQAQRSNKGGLGVVRDQVLALLKLQINPIVQALNATLREHGAR